MKTETPKGEPRSQGTPKSDKPGTKSGTGTEAERMGGIEPARRQAERDWEDSAKESGD
jgi:hypothetical protein